MNLLGILLVTLLVTSLLLSGCINGSEPDYANMQFEQGWTGSGEPGTPYWGVIAPKDKCQQWILVQ